MGREAVYDGVAPTVSLARRERRGLFHCGVAVCCDKARRGFKSSNSSFHLLDWRIGSSPISRLGTVIALPIACRINGHASFLPKLPLDFSGPEAVRGPEEQPTDLGAGGPVAISLSTAGM